MNAPSDMGLLSMRAFGRMYDGKFIGAINDINEVIAAAEYPDVFIFVRATIHANVQQFDLALADLEWLTRDPHTQSEAMNRIAAQSKALIEEGRHHEAACLDNDVGALATMYARAMRVRIALNIEQTTGPLGGGIGKLQHGNPIG